MKPITLLILFQIIASASFSQEATEKEEGVDAISLLSMTIPEANKLLGKPSKIKRGPFTQPFCGMSRGRDEMLTYKKHHVVIETRKKLGYEKRVDLRTSNSKRYYKNCSVWSLKISAKSKLTIDALALNSINKKNIDSKLEPVQLNLKISNMS